VSDRKLIYAGVFLRSTAVGSLRVFLGIFLVARGLTEGETGVVVSAGLAGMMLGTLAVSFFGDRVGRRSSLAGLLALNVAGAAGLLLLDGFWPILAAAFLGMVNGMGRERSAAVALDSAALAQTAEGQDRTGAFARYNVAIDLGHALGSLLGGLPALMRGLGSDPMESYRAAFGVYGALVLGGLGCALLLSRRIEAAEPPPKTVLTPQARRIVLGFAGLSWLDSFGSGFIAGAILSMWISRAFGVDEGAVSILFFLGNLANAVSHYGAAWLAARIGLVNTMVFTHIPSSFFLIGMAFAPGFWTASALYLARELLVEMDVPTRQSYLAAVVRPEERTAAAGLVGVARNLGWASAPWLAGHAMQLLKSAAAAVSPAPLVIAGAIKILYDLALWRSFRSVKPPEERSN
jgi:MFS family permease